MKIYFLTACFLFFQAGILSAGCTESMVTLETGTGTLEGTLLVPDVRTTMPAALLIAGSGPTDRNGNNPATKNNALKMLAEALAAEGVTVLRYDKRGVGKSQSAVGTEAALRFEHYISDAKQWVRFLNRDGRFHEVVIIGHSEGSLIGMAAAQAGGVGRFVSIAGPGLPADESLKAQLRAQPPEILNMALPIIGQLSQGELVAEVPPLLNALFRTSVQPYLISWFQYDPAAEIARLSIPVLILQGTTDIQVSTADAHRLARANPGAELKMIKGMNHILKLCEPDRMKNLATYHQPDLPIASDLIRAISGFILSDQAHDRPETGGSR